MSSAPQNDTNFKVEVALGLAHNTNNTPSFQSKQELSSPSISQLTNAEDVQVKSYKNNGLLEHLSATALQSKPVISNVNGNSSSDSELIRRISTEEMFWNSRENDDSESFFSSHTTQEMNTAEEEDKHSTVPSLLFQGLKDNQNEFVSSSNIHSEKSGTVETCDLVQPRSVAIIVESAPDRQKSNGRHSGTEMVPVQTRLLEQSSHTDVQIIHLQETAPTHETLMKKIRGFTIAFTKEFVGSAWEFIQADQKYKMSSWSLRFLNSKIEDKYGRYELRVLQLPLRILITGFVIPILSQVYIAEKCILSYESIMEECTNIYGGCLVCQSTSTRILALTGVWLLATFLLTCLPEKTCFRPNNRKLWRSGILAFSISAMCNVSMALCANYCRSSDNPTHTFFDHPFSVTSICDLRSDAQPYNAQVQNALSWLSSAHQYWITSTSVYMYLLVAATSLSIQYAAVMGIVLILFAAMLGIGGTGNISHLLGVLIVNMSEALINSIIATYQREIVSRVSFCINIRNARTRLQANKPEKNNDVESNGNHVFSSTLTHVAGSKQVLEVGSTLTHVVGSKYGFGSTLTSVAPPSLVYATLKTVNTTIEEGSYEDNLETPISEGERDIDGAFQYCVIMEERLARLRDQSNQLVQDMTGSEHPKVLAHISENQSSLNLTNISLQQLATLPRDNDNQGLENTEHNAQVVQKFLPEMVEAAQNKGSPAPLSHQQIPGHTCPEFLAKTYSKQTLGQDNPSALNTPIFHNSVKPEISVPPWQANNSGFQTKLILDIIESKPMLLNQPANRDSNVHASHSQVSYTSITKHALQTNDCKKRSRINNIKSVKPARSVLGELFYQFPSEKEVLYLDYSCQRLGSRLQFTAISNGFVAILLALFNLGTRSTAYIDRVDGSYYTALDEGVLGQWWILNLQTVIISLICLVGLRTGRLNNWKLELFTVILCSLMVLLAISYDSWVRIVVPHSTLIHSSNPNVIATFASVTTIRLRPRMHIYVVFCMILASICSAITVQIVGKRFTRLEVTVQFGVILGAVIISVTMSLLFEASQRRYFYLLQLEKNIDRHKKESKEKGKKLHPDPDK